MELFEALMIGVYGFTVIFIAVVIWTDRKYTNLNTWETMWWIMIAVGIPCFLGVPLYYFYRSRNFYRSKNCGGASVAEPPVNRQEPNRAGGVKWCEKDGLQ